MLHQSDRHKPEVQKHIFVLKAPSPGNGTDQMLSDLYERFHKYYGIILMYILCIQMKHMKKW